MSTKICLMWLKRPIPHAVADHDGTQIVAGSIDYAGANASGSRASDDQQRVDPAPHQPRRQIGAKKRGCLSLPDYVLAGQGRQFRHDLARVDIFGQIDQSWYLLRKRPEFVPFNS